MEAALVLPAAAGGQDYTIGMARKEFLDRLNAPFGGGQIVEAKLQKPFSGIILHACMVEQRLDVLKSECDAYLGKNRSELHSFRSTLSQNSIPESKGSVVRSRYPEVPWRRGLHRLLLRRCQL